MAFKIKRWDVFRIRIPLTKPYHLSKIYGTITHSDAIFLRIETEDGIVGWGEANSGGKHFTGDSPKSIMQAIYDGAFGFLKSVNLDAWISTKEGLKHQGSLGAACDVAIHDAVARSRNIPVWKLLGEKKRDKICLLWPISSGLAEEDLQVINSYYQQGFRTFMLKMGDKPIVDELIRLKQVLPNLPDDVKLMVDANQGWTLKEANEFISGVRDLTSSLSQERKLFLIEQPVSAHDLEGMSDLKKSGIPISADESLKIPDDAQKIIQQQAADIFSVKVSKNGGLANCQKIIQLAEQNRISILLNSMIELGVTQSALLHLGAVSPNLLDCGHCYMSTLRTSDDVTNFSTMIENAVITIPDKPGLGIMVDRDKIEYYLVESFHGK